MHFAMTSHVIDFKCRKNQNLIDQSEKQNQKSPYLSEFKVKRHIRVK